MAKAVKQAVRKTRRRPRVMAPLDVFQTVQDNAARYRQMAEEAYNKVQTRGFVQGGDVRDWLEAEKELDFDTTSADNAEK